MHGLGYAAALVLAAVLLLAALAKFGNTAATRRSFGDLGMPAGLAVGVPTVELLVAVGLLVAPGWAAVAALALLAAFTTFLARAIRAGVSAPCNCFGSARRAPVSRVELVRNAALLVGAAVALTASEPTIPHPGAIVTVAALTAFVALVLRRLDRKGPRVGRAAPPLPGLDWGDGALVAFLAPGCSRCELDRPALDARHAHVVDLSPSTRSTFTAYRVRATPFYVAVDSAGIVRACGPELSDLHSAT